MSRCLLPFSLALCFLVAPTTHGAIIAQYEFAGGSGNSTDGNASTDADPMTFTGNATDDSAASSTEIGLSSFSNAMFLRTDAADGIGDDDYFEFTVSGATLGVDVLNLSNLTLDAWMTFGGGAPDADGAEIFLTSDVLGFSTAIGGTDTVVDAGDTEGDPLMASYDLSGASYQGLESITFRIYTGQVETNGDSGLQSDHEDIYRYDDVTLNGTVAVIPEPASLALLGLAGLCVLGRRRRV